MTSRRQPEEAGAARRRGEGEVRAALAGRALGSARPALVEGRGKGQLRILVVDDSRVTRELMKVYLIARDVELLEAADGLEAVELVRRRRPDLVLADVRMPRLDGVGLCAALQADPAMAGVPVLILTSQHDAITEARLLTAGAREVLRKPIQPQPLLAAVRRHLPAEAGARYEAAAAAGGAAAP